VNDERLVVFFILSLVYFQCNEKEKETIENNPKQRELNGITNPAPAIGHFSS